MTEATPYPSQASRADRYADLAEAARRDRGAFGHLYSLYAGPLYRYFWFHTRCRAVAEDLVSDTFFAALCSLPGYCVERGPLGAWLFGIARHTLAQHSKVRRRTQAREEDASRAAERLWDEPKPPLEDRIDLWEAVSELSLPEREVVALKFGGGLSYREIGEVMRMGEVSVGVVLCRALQCLRDRLAGEEDGDAQ